MYIPMHFEETDSERIERVVLENSFGLLVTSGAGRPLCSHVPFLYEKGTLFCHLARANPQVTQLDGNKDVLAVFSGPHAYVSPSWYTSPGVPTWNYVAVHIYGQAVAIRDQDRLRNLVDRMATHFEGSEPYPWTPEYDEAKLRGIVGFEIAISEIQGKFKLSQNRSHADRVNVISNLAAKRTDSAVSTASFMRDWERS